jgi:hypothetical protein
VTEGTVVPYGTGVRGCVEFDANWSSTEVELAGR